MIIMIIILLIIILIIIVIIYIYIYTYACYAFLDLPGSPAPPQGPWGALGVLCWQLSPGMTWPSSYAGFQSHGGTPNHPSRKTMT
jgi:hypothetical protein